MGGEVEITRTSLGEGSCFEVTLPLAAAPGARPVTSLAACTDEAPVQTIDAPDAVTAGSGFAVNYQVVNRGQVGTSGRWNDKVYLSLDNKLSGDDILLDTVSNPQAMAVQEK